eukprot:TRINITY_DN1870_c0_g1_i8.p1 TRINITY_DN1870_c0_g1~~TRINITY_DN1870_c0_g1_i8.p1  ORF type:complete len:435 (+),score=34.90 TRINITY_DN1870_c0_g1_i8:115-1419(+)
MTIKSNCSRFWESQLAVRRAVEAVDLPSWYAAVWLSTNIEWLMSGVAYLTKAGPADLGINRIMSTFMLLSWVKEMNGRERYSLNAVFFRTNFKPPVYPSTNPDSLFMKFNARYGPEPSTYSSLFLLVSSERVYVDLFSQTASDYIVDLYNRLLAQRNAQIAATLKLHAINNPDSPNLGVSPMEWFSNQTVRMNQIKIVSDDISGQMVDQLSDRYWIYIRDMAQFVLTILGALSVAVTGLFSFGAAVWFWRVTGDKITVPTPRNKHWTTEFDTDPGNTKPPHPHPCPHSPSHPAAHTSPRTITLHPIPSDLTSSSTSTPPSPLPGQMELRSPHSVNPNTHAFALERALSQKKKSSPADSPLVAGSEENSPVQHSPAFLSPEPHHLPEKQLAEKLAHHFGVGPEQSPPPAPPFTRPPAFALDYSNRLYPSKYAVPN